tara:strand:- start:329 stop:697 length:369 start_codon:yes stop_codon:yes gene_type:complete
VNLSISDHYKNLNELCDQIFDYFNLTIYDLESKLDNQFSIEHFKNKLDTFSDKHFNSALFDFNNEIKYLKNHFPNELFQIEKLSDEIKESFNDLFSKKILDIHIMTNLKVRLKNHLNKIKVI